MSYLIVILVTAAVCLPAGAYLFYRYGSALKADAQAVQGEVTKIVGKGKASEK